MASAIKNTFYYTLGTVVKSAAAFVLLPLYANILGAEQYGVLNLLQTFSTILGTLMTFATERSLYRMYHDYASEEEKRILLSTVFWAINLFSIVIILCTISVGGYIVNYLGNVNVYTALLPTVLYTFLMALINYSQVLMQVEQKGRSFLIVSMLVLVTYNAISILFLYFYDRTVESLIYGNVIANLIVLPVAFMNIRKRISFQLSFRILADTLKFSLPIFFSIVFSWVLNMTDRLFIANMGSMYDAGLYSLASKLGQFAILACGAIYQAYTPYFYDTINRDGSTEFLEKTAQSNKYITLFVCIVVVCLVYATKPLLLLFFNVEFYDSLYYVYLLAIGILFNQIGGMFNMMVYQQKKSVQMAIVTVSCGIISLVMNYILIPRYGSLASGYTQVVVNMLLCISVYALAKKYLYIPVGREVVLAFIPFFVAGGIVDSIGFGVVLNIISKLLLFTLCLLYCYRKQFIPIALVNKYIAKIKH